MAYTWLSPTTSIDAESGRRPGCNKTRGALLTLLILSTNSIEVAAKKKPDRKTKVVLSVEIILKSFFNWDNLPQYLA